MYTLCPANLDWRLFTSYVVDGLKKIFWNLDETPKALEPSLLELHLVELNRQTQPGRARVRRARG